MMKRYLLFSGDDFYPRGGMEDFKGYFDSAEEARTFLQHILYDWYHIYDLELKQIIETQ